MSHKPNMDLNTIFAAILIAGIVGMLSSFISRKLTIPYFPAEQAFPIEVTDVSVAAVSDKPAGPDPILALLSTADIEKGGNIAKQCAACHNFEQGGAHRIGPNLHAIVGAPLAAKDGYAYSDALIDKNENWTYQALNHFFWKPKDYAPGTKMNYIGLKKPQDRADLIAWLRLRGSESYPLPTEAEIAAEMPEEKPIEISEEDEAQLSEEAVEELIEDGTGSDDIPEAAVADDVDGELTIEEAEELLIP